MKHFLGTTLAAAAITLGLSGPAAANDYRLDHAGDQGAYPRASADFEDRTGALRSRGDLIPNINCFVEGQRITNRYGYESPFWLRDADGHFWSEAWLETGSNGLPTDLPACDDIDKPIGQFLSGYDGSAAAQWAMENYQYPERYPDGDCTWFLSKALRIGGLPESEQWATPEFLDPPNAAILADAMFDFLTGTGVGVARAITWSDNTASGAEVGDVIAYDWDGPADGTIDHLALVTTVNVADEPSVTQHTPAQLNRYWSWSEGYNDWIEHAYPGSAATLIDMTP